jgi:Rieske Fe-S protein
MSAQNRREFLVTLAAGTTAVASTCLLGTGCGVDVPPSAAGPDVDTAGQVKFQPGTFSQVDKVGGAVMLNVAGLPQPVLLIRLSEGEYKATSGLCTHVACPVGYDKVAKVIECPCHRAQFALDGRVLRKPAISPLSSYPVRTDLVTGELVIDTRGADVPALVDGKVEFPVARFFELEDVDGTFAFTPTGMSEPIIVLRYESARIFAFDAYSTAARCVVEYSADRRRLVDPCTGSEFDIDGTVRNGPAKTALKRYATSFDGKTITITVA